MINMKSARIPFFLLFALSALNVAVYARPLVDSKSMAIRDSAPFDGLTDIKQYRARGDEPSSKGNSELDPDVMINTPLLADGENPVKRDGQGFDPETLINTPPLIEADNNEPIRRNSVEFDPEVLINRPAMIETDNNEPIKRENSGIGSDASINPQSGHSNSNRRPIAYSSILDSITRPDEGESSSESATDGVHEDTKPKDDLPMNKRNEEMTRRKIPGVNIANYFSTENAGQEDGSDDLFEGISGGKSATCHILSKRSNRHADNMSFNQSRPNIGIPIMAIEMASKQLDIHFTVDNRLGVGVRSRFEATRMKYEILAKRKSA